MTATRLATGLLLAAVTLLTACADLSRTTHRLVGKKLALPVGHALVWSDEFDRPGLPDPARWVHDTGRNKGGWYNKEQQYHSGPRVEDAVVHDGRLHTTARKESLRDRPDWGGQAYTSARLITRGKADWTYGFFEIRARMPCGQGAEIDLPSACSHFHDYQMLWTPQMIRFGVDGVEHFRYLNPGTGRDAWPFDAPQFLILNIAIGGDLGGPVDDTTFPVTMEVEHVRVYQALSPKANP